MEMIKRYYQLTKPGIVMGNAITVVGGFILASQGHVDFFLLLATVVGLSGVMASGCIFNNYMDRLIDQKMARTQTRALVTGAISVQNALIFASCLGILGFVLLLQHTNVLTVLMALLGFCVYVFLYTVLKTRTVYCTAIGSISGAVPLIVGYVAVTNHFDLCSLILFLTMVAWQMPHFFAIAMYRIRDYQAAAIPVLPVKKGNFITKVRMLAYVIAFMGCVCLMTFLGYTGYLYMTVGLVLGCAWLKLAIQGFKAENDIAWARQMFKVSLFVITGLCVAMALDSFMG